MNFDVLALLHVQDCFMKFKYMHLVFLQYDVICDRTDDHNYDPHIRPAYTTTPTT